MYAVIYCTLYEHNTALLALAFGLCVASTGVAVGLKGRAKGAIDNRRRDLWLLCQGLVAGGGTWATHFVAMLAYNSPVEIGFALLPTLASLIFGVVLACSAFLVSARYSGSLGIVGAGLLFGAAVAGLHFIGMLGLEASATHVWNATLVTASTLLCGAFSVAAMIALRREGLINAALAAALFVLTVLSLHFTAMSAVTLIPNGQPSPAANVLDATGLAITITIIVAATLLVVAILAFTEQKILFAEARSAAKSQFLASMSHELRTPLASIVAYAEVIGETAAEDGRNQDRDDAQVIVDSSKHLLALISEILDFAKLEAGKIELEWRTFDISSFVDSVLTITRPLAIKGSNRLLTEVEPDLGTIRTDEVRLRQAVLNLLSNAAKFTSNGEIKLRVRSEHQGAIEGVSIEVSDTGIGMTPNALKRAFEPFSQADETIGRRYGGTGLGLPIVKQLVEHLGGALKVSSKEHVGSTFNIWVPLDPRTPIYPVARVAQFKIANAAEAPI